MVILNKEVYKNLINSKIIKFYDICFSSVILFCLSPLIVLILIICFLETGNPIFIQKRVGKDQKSFNLIKFRTMKINTPSLASHLIHKSSVTRFGKIIRQLKLDELPQLINVIKGDMSLVGPRPCLLNQLELIEFREKYKVFQVKPGITGLSQINGIDMSNPKKLAESDFFMLKKINQKNYFKYLILTFFGKGFGDKVRKK